MSLRLFRANYELTDTQSEKNRGPRNLQFVRYKFRLFNFGMPHAEPDPEKIQQVQLACLVR